MRLYGKYSKASIFRYMKKNFCDLAVNKMKENQGWPRKLSVQQK